MNSEASLDPAVSVEHVDQDRVPALLIPLLVRQCVHDSGEGEAGDSEPCSETGTHERKVVNPGHRRLSGRLNQGFSGGEGCKAEAVICISPRKSCRHRVRPDALIKRTLFSTGLVDLRHDVHHRPVFQVVDPDDRERSWLRGDDIGCHLQ